MLAAVSIALDLWQRGDGRILRVMFAVDDLDETLARLLKHGAELVGEVVQYEDSIRLCHIRGPEGLLVALAEELG